MSDKEKNNSNEILPALHILLPVCVELKTDVFLKILKNVVNHARMDDFYLDAIRAGMTDSIHVKSKDISDNWKELNSKSQQRRQLKLIGFWATHNFPTLGKKLLGETWHPPQRSGVELTGGVVITAREIDECIFKKLKLRAIDLRVGESNLPRLKHFVQIPDSVGKLNPIPIPPKMISYQIEDDHHKNCWKALKHGRFSITEQPIQLNQREHVRARTEDRVIFNRNGFQLVPVAKRARLDEETLSIGAPSRPTTTTVPCKDIDVDNANAADVNVHNTTDVHNGSSIDSTQAALIEMRKVGNLSGLLHRHLSGHDTETANGPEYIHDLIIKQKDEEIERMKATVQELQESNQRLKSKEVIDRDTVLINTLQKLADANSKLHIQSERDLTTSCDLVQALNVEIKELKSRIESLSGKLAEAASTKLDMDHQCAKLQNSLNEMKNYAEMKDVELDTANKTLSEKEKLQKDIDDLTAYTANIVSDLKTQIDNLDESLTASAKVNTETLEQKRKLEAELIDLREYAAKKDNELKEVNKSFSVSVQTLNDEITELKSRIESLSEKLAEAASTKLDMDHQCAKLQNSLNEMKNYAEMKDVELDTANKTLSEKEKLQKDIDDLTAYTANIVSDLKTQIDNLDESLTASAKVNTETLEQKRKLEAELIDLREYAAKKDNELKEVNKSFSVSVQTLNDEITELKSRIESLSEKLAEAASTKLDMDHQCAKLQNSLNEMKNYAEMKDVELDTANKTLSEKEKLQKDIDDLTAYTANIVSDLKTQIDNLDESLTASAKVNTETLEQKLKLEAELSDLREYAAKNDNELKEVKKAFSELRLQLDLSLTENRKTADAESQTDTSNEMEQASTEDEKNVDVICDTKLNVGVPCDTEPNTSVSNDSEPVFVTNDPIVRECREKLRKLKFAWIKFYPTKNARYSPGFIYPKDPDGSISAQQVMADGYPSNSKYQFFDFDTNFPDNRKLKSEVSALNNFNNKFGFSYV